MWILTTRNFFKWAKKQKISKDCLLQAAMESIEGQFEADLGGGVIKKRVPLNNRGKSSGIRTILFFKQGSRLVYVHGFKKNEKANISNVELAAFKQTAKIILSMGDKEICDAINLGNFVEITS